MDACCLVNQLLSEPFSRKNFADKNLVVLKGRPMPKLSLKTKHKEKGKTYERHFKSEFYNRYKWLTACKSLNLLFCWPCLLFASEKNVWTKKGYVNLSSLSTAAKCHETTRNHVTSVLRLKFFGNVRIEKNMDKANDIKICQHNNMVQKNIDILKRLVDVVCFLAMQELPFRGHDERVDSSNRGNYVETLGLLSTYDSVLSNHLKTATVFKGVSKHIQNDLINAVSNVVLNTIKEEITQAPFVALLLDETSDISNQSQLSTTLRYVVKESGKVQERFVGFTDVSADRSAEGLLKHVVKIVEEYGLQNKLAAQCFDGASVMSGHATGLKARVLEKYPTAFFVHCFAHKLNLVLSQATSAINVCKTFFRTLSSLGSFFAHSTKRANHLKEFTNKKMPKNAPTRWNFSSRLVNTVNDYYEAFKLFFRNIVEDDDKWDNDTIVLAQGFLAFLSKPINLFLLKVFSKIFSYTDVLFNLLQTKSLDIVYCTNKVNETKQSLAQMRENYCDFDIDYEEIIGDIFSKSARHSVDKKALYYEIIDNITVQLNERFCSLQKLEFFALLDRSSYKKFAKSFPVETFKKLNETYDKWFDCTRLKNELMSTYSFADLSDKAPHQLLSTLKEKELDDAMPELYKLCQLIVTIPSTTASVERSFSALKRIKDYQRATQGQDRVSALSLLSIEKLLLQSLKDKPGFYENVIKEFTKQERRMEFTYI